MEHIAHTHTQIIYTFVQQSVVRSYCYVEYTVTVVYRYIQRTVLCLFMYDRYKGKNVLLIYIIFLVLCLRNYNIFQDIQFQLDIHD